MIKSIIFDWGGVLIENPSKKLMEYCAKQFEVDVELFKKAFLKHGFKFEKGLIEESKLWVAVAKELRCKVPRDKIWGDAVDYVFKNQNNVIELAKKLKLNGYKVGFLSNTELPALHFFYENGYNEIFDEYIFSCIEHYAKPEKEIYEIALKKLGVKPEEALFIDDIEKYVAGAKSVGINAILFKSYDLLLEELRRFGIKV